MPRTNTAEALYIQNRVSMPSAKSSAEISRDIPEAIRNRAFFSARVAEAHILDRLREVSDDYSAGKIGRQEAVTLLRDFLGAEKDANGKPVYDLQKKGLANLASHSRLNLIMRQNERMAKAVGEYERMFDPEIMEAFPYVIYHTGQNARPSHAKLEGKIFSKNDPFLLAHWPPWDFNCNCYLEDCTARRAGRTPQLIQPVTPADKVSVDRDSGFAFDPRNGFENNAENLEPLTRQSVIRQVETAVRNGALDNVGIVVRGVRPGVMPVPLPAANDAKQSIQEASQATVDYLRRCGIKVDDVHDETRFKEVNRKLRQYAKDTLQLSKNEAKNFARNIPDEIMKSIPDKEISMGTLHSEFAAAAGLEELPVTLEKGDGNFGISHLWRDHKDLFLNPTRASLILQETLGWPECRVVVSLKQEELRDTSHKGPEFVCRKKIVLHNPKTRAYLVMRLADDEKSLQIVSFNRAPDSYGTKQWAMK